MSVVEPTHRHLPADIQMDSVDAAINNDHCGKEVLVTVQFEHLVGKTCFCEPASMYPYCPIGAKRFQL